RGHARACYCGPGHSRHTRGSSWIAAPPREGSTAMDEKARTSTSSPMRAEGRKPSAMSRSRSWDDGRLLRPACPACGGTLFESGGKLQCARCHTICETCCEGGRG